MNTLQTIRRFAFTTVLAAAAVMAPVTHAADECLSDSAAYATGENAVASLGHMVVTASRTQRVASLGVLVVTARGEAAASVADLGTMTVNARRDGTVRFANLGAMTVSAPGKAGRRRSRARNEFLLGLAPPFGPADAAGPFSLGGASLVNRPGHRFR